MAREVAIGVDGAGLVSGLSVVPDAAQACLVLAHGAGAGMAHPFLDAVASGLSSRRVATLRFQFPFMEAGSRRPDTPARAQAAVRAAVDEAARLTPDLPLFAGGKSFGGRMTSQAQAAGALPGVRGLVFLGFPLHPANKPALARGDHLDGIRVPMLFVQGTRDALADNVLVAAVTARLGALATLVAVADADHAFHVRKSSGRSDAAALAQVLDDMVAWMALSAR